MDSGDPRLDGSVVNAIEMIEKLAASERVEQVFVRHAFRFWMGRNETMHDAPILKAAHKAYRDNGGSMNGKSSCGWGLLSRIRHRRHEFFNR